MIGWLASYPRSGNTLLRQVLHRCFGLTSFEAPDAAGSEAETAAWREACATYGGRFLGDAAAATLAAARASNEPVLVKTHGPPPEGQDRAVYVVRDGRLALRSYVKFQQTYHPEAASFAGLLLGDSGYLDWTTHHDVWCERPARPLLVIRFEELIDVGPDLLLRLAQFIGHNGDVRPWVNPQEKLQGLVPEFFGEGAPSWRPDNFWTPGKLRQFYTVHGPLLLRLGYAAEREVSEGAYPAGSDEEQLLSRAWRTARRCQELQLAYSRIAAG